MDGRFHYVAKLRQLFLLAVFTVSLLVPITTATARCYNPGAAASRLEEQLREEQALTPKTAYTGVFDPGQKVQIGLLRWYDPNLQRWINRDPLGEYGGFNLYRFTDNSPLNEVDPFGADAIIIVGRNKADPSYFTTKANDFARAYDIFNALWGKRATVCQVRSVEDVQKALNHPNIDTLVYFGHSNAASFYLSEKELKNTDVKGLDCSNVQPNADVRLFGCSTAVGPNSMAQAFANKLRQPVVGAAGPLSFGIPLRFGFGDYNLYLGTLLPALPRGAPLVAVPPKIQ